MQLNELSINTSQPGRMVLQPHTGGWYEDWRGTLVYKEVTGDFVATTRVRISDRDDIGNSDEDSIPGDGDYSLGGLMIRTPRDIENGAADWTPGSRQDDGTSNGENYIFLSMGFTTGDNRFSFEVKSTRNSSSNLQITPLSATPDEVELQIARIGTSVIALYRLEGETEWTVHRRYSRPDMPQTMQIGMVAYTDWEKLNDFEPIVHNANTLTSGAIADPTPWQPFNPDITAAYDYTRFARPDVPAALAGADLTDPGAVPDSYLLTFLGSAANLDPNAVPDPDGNPGPDPDPGVEPGLHVTRVGSNLSHVVDWDPAWIFKDAFQRARPWGVRAQNVDTGETMWQFSLGEGPELSLDESGWVTALPEWQHSSGEIYQQLATTVVFTGDANQPAGIYTAEWDGNGTLQMPFVIESGVTAEGRNYALIDMPFNAHFTMNLTSTDPADPVRNIDLWMPDYNGQSFVGDHWQPGDSGSPFHPLFLERVDDFDTLRFMDWMNTNNSDIVTWEDRRLVTQATQSDGDLVDYLHTNGVAAEYLIELANTVDANPWFNMPHQADDDFVRNFATLVRDTLDPDLTIHVEWSNELWNAQFAVNQWLLEQATLPENAGLDFFQIAGREIQRDFDIWSEVFEGQEHRLVRVVAGQQANPWLTEQLLINVDGRVDAVSATAYAGIGYEMALGYDANTTADDIIDDLLNVSIPWASARLQEHQALVQEYEALLGRDLQFVTYESGSHVFAAPNPFLQSPALDAALEAMHSPRMYDVYQTLLGAVHAAGVDLYNEFNFTSHDGANFFGTYGLLHDMTTPLSEAHQLRSLLDFAAAQNPDEETPPPAVNHAPVADHPAPVEILEGSLLTLAIQASDPDAGQQLQYQLDEDAPAGAAIDELTGVITWVTPDASDADFYGFTVIVSDDGSPQLTTEVFVEVTVLNAAPVAAMEGPATSVRGQPRQFTLLASDLSAADQNADFTFDIDWNGDGTIDETVTGPSGLQVEHTFEVYGAQRVLVTAWDRNEMPSAPVEWNVWVATAELQTINGQSVLVVGATTGTDNITISPRNARMVDVRINRTAAQRFAGPDRVIVYGQAGHDRITLDTRLSMPAELYGEAGNDTLTGGSGSDILIGGDGNDWLYGQEGRDVLIGGDGVDRLRGAGEQDLLIAGRTSFDARPADLRLIQNEWTSGRNYPTRVANLTGTAGGSVTRSNDSVQLTPSTVFEDESVDLIFGGAERDFFFAALHELNDRRPNESLL